MDIQTKPVRRVVRQEILKGIMNFLYQYHRKHDFMPTLDEIGKNFKHTKQWASHYLLHLEVEKKIKLIPGKQRGIKLVIK